MGVLTETQRKLLNEAQQKGWVIGLKDITKDPGVRRDIDDLILNAPEAFNLFVLALRNLQEPGRVTDKLGFYQIAGIHGLPRGLWEGEKVYTSTDERAKVEDTGYCHHGHLGFGPWHRPYLAMMEQAIFYEMVQIAEKDFPEEKYFRAVREWRLPFWDYFKPRGGAITYSRVLRGDELSIDWSKIFSAFSYDCGVPDVFTIPALKVRKTSKSEPELISNPFAKFSLNQTGGMQDTDWDVGMRSGQKGFPGFDRNGTTRWPGDRAPKTLKDSFSNLVQRSTDVDKVAVPTVDVTQKAHQVTDALNTAVNWRRESNIRLLWSMMNDPSYAQFSAFGSQRQTPGASGNLEGSIHGGYHNLVGGPRGHMSSVPVAAFDPVFWIHHCQVDRIFAIWQKIHAESWFDSVDAEKAAIADEVRRGIIRDGKAALAEVWYDPDRVLAPFRTSKHGQSGVALNKQYWTANDSRSLSPFGYEYPETVPKSGDALKLWKDAYNWSWRQDTNGTFKACPPEMKPLNMTKAAAYQMTPAEIDVWDGRTLPKASVRTARMAAAPVPEFAALEAAPAPVEQQVLVASVNPEDRSFTNFPAQAPENATNEDIDESQVMRSWYIDMLVERLALNGSFAIHYFLGEFEDEPLDYYLQTASAGANNVFAAPIRACDNCGIQAEQALNVTDTNDITPKLIDYVHGGALTSLSAADVIPFLKQHLKWRVVTVTGERVDPRTIGSLKMGVSSRLAPKAPATGPLRYQEFPGVIEEIIGGAS